MAEIEALISEIDRAIDLSQQIKQAASDAEWDIVTSLSPHRDQCIQALAKLKAEQVVTSVRKKLDLLALLDQEILREVTLAKNSVKNKLEDTRLANQSCSEYEQMSR